MERVDFNGAKITSIGQDAFYECQSLKELIIPNTVKSIGDYAFEYCAVETLIFEEGSQLAKIYEYGFYGAYNLTEFRITSNVTSIGEEAFAECESLMDITVDDSIEKIDATSFRDSGYYKHHANWKDGLLYLGKWVIGCNGSTGEYLIRSGTVGIASDVFANELHIKRTKNPEYDDVLDWFNAALECPNMMLPDLSHTPEYFEEIIPAKIRYA